MPRRRQDHVIASYNNEDGINSTAGAGNYADVTATFNGWGIIVNGILTRALAQYNSGIGIYASGVVRDSTAEFNGGDGVNASQHGVVIDSTAWNNGGAGFTMSSSV